LATADSSKQKDEAKAMPVFAYRCPQCHAPLTPQRDELACVNKHRYRLKNGIWPLLTAEARTRWAAWLKAYTTVRDEEGFSRAAPDSDLGPNAAYYMALPDYDLSGLYSATWKMRGRNYHDMAAHLKRQLPGELSILDLGAGNGWMSRHLSEAGNRLCALDINMDDGDGLPTARVYFARLPIRFARVEGEMANLPFEDAQFDAVIANASLHYLADPTAAIGEAARALKPGGAFIVLDSPFYTDATAGERMIADLKAAYTRYNLPPAAAGSYFSYDDFSAKLAAVGFGQVEWRGRWRRGTLNPTALFARAIGALRERGREQPGFPIVFAYKVGAA
jgi:ubiquinone/menaquinone biosynthesis C-methylase UbiE